MCWPGSQANEGVLLIIGGVYLSSAEEREPCAGLLDFAFSSIFVQLRKSSPSSNLIRGPQRAFVSSQLPTEGHYIKYLTSSSKTFKIIKK